jgi:hypothetical protein
MSDVSEIYYWECQPSKGGECPAPVKTLPANPLPGGAATGMPWLRIGLHKDHEAQFWLHERPRPEPGIPIEEFMASLRS